MVEASTSTRMAHGVWITKDGGHADLILEALEGFVGAGAPR